MLLPLAVEGGMTEQEEEEALEAMIASAWDCVNNSHIVEPSSLAQEETFSP